LLLSRYLVEVVADPCSDGADHVARHKPASNMFKSESVPKHTIFSAQLYFPSIANESQSNMQKGVPPMGLMTVQVFAQVCGAARAGCGGT
jgi:hypothetical protein